MKGRVPPPFDPLGPTRDGPLASPHGIARAVIPPGFFFGARYRAEAFLGAGGMGTVYAGFDNRTGRQVAIKVLNPGAGTVGERRFVREAEFAFSVKHPHLCEVLDFGFEAGLPFIVMERLHGETVLDRLMRSGTFGVADTLTIAGQLLMALGAAHATGVIHRDVKPGNLFLLTPPGAQPWSKLIDFGVAKALPDASHGGGASVPITALDVIPGTPAFLTPEQLRPNVQLDARVDLWAVGVTLFEMLTGRRPFEGRTSVELARRILRDPAPLVSSLRPDVPPALDGVIQRALAKDRDERFASASEMNAALPHPWSTASQARGGPGPGPGPSADGDDDDAVTLLTPRR